MYKTVAFFALFYHKFLMFFFFLLFFSGNNLKILAGLYIFIYYITTPHMNWIHHRLCDIHTWTEYTDFKDHTRSFIYTSSFYYAISVRRVLEEGIRLSLKILPF